MVRKDTPVSAAISGARRYCFGVLIFGPPPQSRRSEGAQCLGQPRPNRERPGARASERGQREECRVADTPASASGRLVLHCRASSSDEAHIRAAHKMRRPAPAKNLLSQVLTGLILVKDRQLL